MNFNHHGHYTLQQEAGYFVVSYMGSWNEEAARSFVQTFKSLIKESGLKKFGIITNLNEWEGATPEALLIGKEATDEFYKMGEIVSIHLTNSVLKQHFMQAMQELQASRMSFKQCDNLDMAKKWMETKLKELL